MAKWGTCLPTLSQLDRSLDNQVWYQAWVAIPRSSKDHELDLVWCEYVCAALGSLTGLCLIHNGHTFLCALGQYSKEDNNTSLCGWAVVCRMFVTGNCNGGIPAQPSYVGQERKVKHHAKGWIAWEHCPDTLQGRRQESSLDASSCFTS